MAISLHMQSIYSTAEEGTTIDSEVKSIVHISTLKYALNALYFVLTQMNLCITMNMFVLMNIFLILSIFISINRSVIATKHICKKQSIALVPCSKTFVG